MEQYPTNELAWLFWLFVFTVGVLALLVFAYLFKKCKKSTNTPINLNPMDDEYFNEPVTYIFKTDKGIIVKNAHKVPHQFTIDKAKHYAKCFSDYEIQMYGETQWHSCSTYFK